jgi:hypothetical protein
VFACGKLKKGGEMAQFVLVAIGINGQQLQKAMEVVNKSNGKLNFVPQQTNSQSVTSPGMSSHKDQQTPNKPEEYNHARFEWNHDAASLGSEVIQALASK